MEQKERRRTMSLTSHLTFLPSWSTEGALMSDQWPPAQVKMGRNKERLSGLLPQASPRSLVETS
jgi:hypothetical protein